MSTTKWVATTMVSLSIALSFVACLSRTTGNEGNLSFEYVADDRPLDFNKPIAVGARLDLRVRQAGTLAAVDAITRASVDDEATLRIVAFDGPTVTVEGVASGNGLLSVDALSDGVTLSDSVNLLARQPEVLALRHSCTSEDSGYYLTDQRIWLWFDMRMANDQPVIGYGYHPVSFSPAEGLTLDTETRNPQWLELDTGSTTGPVSIASDIDETTLTVELVEPGAIDGAMMIGEYGALVDWPTWYYALPTIGGVPVCQAVSPIEIDVLTPTICEVTLPVTQPTDQELEDSTGEPIDESSGPNPTINEVGWIRVLGAEVGVCELALTYVEGAAGAGVETILSVDIIDVERPEDDEADG